MKKIQKVWKTSRQSSLTQSICCNQITREQNQRLEGIWRTLTGYTLFNTYSYMYSPASHLTQDMAERLTVNRLNGKRCAICPHQQIIDLVNGFTSESTSRKIPIEVVRLCISYYFSECFAQCADSYSTNVDKLIISKRTHSRECGFGNVCIDSMEECVHLWTFEILEAEWNMGFGITDFDNHDLKSDNFLYFSGYKTSRKLDKKKSIKNRLKKIPNKFIVQKGSILQMMLDLRRRNLKRIDGIASFGKLFFFTNQVCGGIGPADQFIECAEGLCYKMAVILQHPNSKVILRGYKKQVLSELL